MEVCYRICFEVSILKLKRKQTEFSLYRHTYKERFMRRSINVWMGGQEGDCCHGQAYVMSWSVGGRCPRKIYEWATEMLTSHCEITQTTKSGLGKSKAIDSEKMSLRGLSDHVVFILLNVKQSPQGHTAYGVAVPDQKSTFSHSSWGQTGLFTNKTNVGQRAGDPVTSIQDTFTAIAPVILCPGQSGMWELW